jgi:hypothetical protein
MTRKPILDSGLIVSKTAAETVTLGAPQRQPTQRVVQPESPPAPQKEPLVSFGFKVPASWVKQFQRYAFDSDRKNNKLLFDAFEAIKEKEGKGGG